jgi:hypothetical protein
VRAFFTIWQMFPHENTGGYPFLPKKASPGLRAKTVVVAKKKVATMALGGDN